MAKESNATSPFPNGKIADYFSSTEVKSIDPSLIHPLREDDPRINRALPKLFVESIERDGQLNPVLLYPKGDGTFACISGLQRKKAIALLRRKQGNGGLAVKALVADPTLGDLGQLIAAVAANDRVVPQTGIERAFYIVQGLDDCGGNQSELARRMGVDEGTVRNARLLVEQSTPELMKAVNQGVIADTTALKIVKETKDNPEKQKEVVAEVLKKAEEKAQAQEPSADGKKPEKVQPAKISAAELLDQKPNVARIKRVIEAKGTPKAVAEALQWATGEITTSVFAATQAWFNKVQAELAIEDEKAAKEAQEKAKAKQSAARDREANKAERDAEKAKRKAEKDAEKERMAAMSPTELAEYQKNKKEAKLRAELAKLQEQGKTASSQGKNKKK